MEKFYGKLMMKKRKGKGPTRKKAASIVSVIDRSSPTTKVGRCQCTHLSNRVKLQKLTQKGRCGLQACQPSPEAGIRGRKMRGGPVSQQRLYRRARHWQ